MHTTWEIETPNLWFTQMASEGGVGSQNISFILVFVFDNILTLGVLRSAISHIAGCFCPLTFFQNIGFSMVPFDPFMSHLATQLGYSTWEFQALQLIVLAAFGVVDYSLASCMWVHFRISTFQQQLGGRFDIMDSKSSLFHWYFDM